MPRSQLYISQILKWADAHYERTGRWPTKKDGKVFEDKDEKWLNIDQALRNGHRGLPRESGWSLPRLLAAYRGYRNRKALPHYALDQILAWADAFRKRTGDWPYRDAGPIPEAPGETWNAVDAALKSGIRGLPGGSSLPQLLWEQRGVRNLAALPALTTTGILQWADQHYQLTGQWPSTDSGPVDAAPGETWNGIDTALRSGLRGLPGGSSLAQLLRQARGISPRHRRRPRLDPQDIIQWAKAYHEREGQWPHNQSGPIPESPENSWRMIDRALSAGKRGLPGGQTLARFLEEQCAAPIGVERRGRLSLEHILAWADAHHQRTGAWPTRLSGPIPESGEDTWHGIDIALKEGTRGLPGGTCLAEVLWEERGVRNKKRLPPLLVEQILVWADAYHEQRGQWPKPKSGSIPGTGETWRSVDSALRLGLRHLPGGSSLPQLLAEKRKAPHAHRRPPLSHRKILQWARAYHEREERWPTASSGTVAESPEENWSALDLALRRGYRGLPGGSSLHQLLAHRRAPARGEALPR